MTEKLLFDAELAWKVYDHIAAHPEEWRQFTWMMPVTDETCTQIKCGTKACYAGTLALMIAPQGTQFFEHEMRIHHSPESEETLTYWEYALNTLTKGTTDRSTDDVDGRSLRMRVDRMFSALNNLEDIKNMITYLANCYPST